MINLKNISLALAAGFCTIITTNAQEKVTISGYIKEASNGEAIIGAEVAVTNGVGFASTNEYGFYSIDVPSGEVKLSFSYFGLQSIDTVFNVSSSTKVDVELREGVQSYEKYDEVVISDTRRDANVNNTEVGTNTLNTEQIKKLPVIFGETDLLKAVQLLPGVQSAGEANSGFYVRGGGPDQNLILLDDAVVYNSGHLFGFFSIFNSDAIKNLTLIKGGIPAQYGGRLSSVLDVKMKEGNLKEYKGEGGIGLIASRLTFEGPIVKDKGSFIISGRRTYIDALMAPFLKGELKGTGYYFYDANLKANYQLSSKDRIYLSSYFGRDVFNYNSSSGNFSTSIPWGNFTSTLRWNREWSPKLFMNTMIIYNDYDFALKAEQSVLNIQYQSAIRDIGAKTDFTYYLNNNHVVKFGAQVTNHKFIPNQFSGMSDTASINPNNSVIKHGNEFGIYIADEMSLGSKLKVNAGLRLAGFNHVGPYKHYIKVGNSIVDTIEYAKGESVHTYWGVEPRMNFRYSLTPSSSLKGSVTRSLQFLHLVSNNGSTLPTDIWVPSTKVVKPQIAWQYSLGYFQNFRDNSIETSVEVYYKDLRNQIEFRNGYVPGLGEQELDFVFGRGYAYGAEFLVNKTKGRLTGWIGYTLSWAWRDFPDLNDGEMFPAKYDRRHDISVVATYEINKKWTVSGVFIYGTGNAITLPTSMYMIDGSLIQNYSKINQYRIPAYHRMDLSATWTPGADKPNKKFSSSWSFGIYNAYSRLNPYFMYLDYDGTIASGGTQLKVMSVSIFPIIPSITWNFKF